MYFLNMLFSKPQLFFIFFLELSAVFIPIYMFYQHINLRQCCCISIS